jgi:integrase
MPKKITPLNDTQIRNAKAGKKPLILRDGDGLVFIVHPNGSKYIRQSYRLNSKENTYSIGLYPQISLAEAREIRGEIKKMVKSGIDPNKQRKLVQFQKEEDESDNFAFVTWEWFSKNSKKWTEDHAKKLKGWIEQDIIPQLGHIKTSDIKSPDILKIVKKVENRGALDVARRVLSICSQVLRYAIPLGKCDYDVTVGINKTLEVRKRENFKSIPIEEFPELLKRIENHKCNPLTKLGLKLIALTFVRSSELREAKWSEINFDKAEWRIPAERMKMKELHIVPLSKQAIKNFQEIKKFGLNDEYIFPSVNNPRKVMSENTLLYALYDMGYHNKMTVHGFRQIASTILNEQGFRADVIERQLSHAERDNVRRAYNHAQYLSERREMMSWWGEFIEKQK